MVNDIQSHLDHKRHKQTYPLKNMAQIIVFDENQFHNVHITAFLRQWLISGDLGFSGFKTSVYKCTC